MASLRKIGQIPSQLSELNQFGNLLSYGNLRWGCSLGDRVYIGAPYADNRAYCYKQGGVAALGRMSVPKPFQFTGYNAAPFTAAAAADAQNGNVVGDIDPDETPIRYYKISYASEQTARVIRNNTTTPQGSAEGGGIFPIFRFNDASSTFLRTQGDLSYAETTATGQGADPTQDARDAWNLAPAGGYGQMCDAEISVEIKPGDTLVEVSALAWPPHADFLPNVTHAYVWASPESYAAGGQFRFVGKIPYDKDNGFSGGLLYDTLSASALAGRLKNAQDWLDVPTFTAACRTKNRLVGIAGGSNVRFPSSTYGFYANIDRSVNPRLVVLAEDTAGTVATTAEWPRCLELGGFRLQFEGSGEAYEIEYIDPNDRTKAYLTRDYQGPSAVGMAVEARGANNLQILSANLQQQEQRRAAWLLDGWNEFGDILQTVADDPVGDGFFVFTSGSTWYVSGIPVQEDTQSVLAFPARKRLVSLDYGAAGTLACCPLQDGVAVITGQGDLVKATAMGVQPFSYVVNDLLRKMTFTDKSLATMAYDGTRKNLYVTLPYLDGVARTPGEWPGLDSREVLVVFNVETGSFTLWTGGRWRYVCAVPPQGEGMTGPGSGAQVLFQDWVADVVLLDERRLIDKEAIGFGTVTQGKVLSVSSGIVLLDDVTLPPFLRGQYIVVVSGENAGSFAEVYRRTPGGNGCDIGAWSRGAPAPGDHCMIGAITVEYQSGALTPTEETLPWGLVVGYKAEIDDENAGAAAWWTAKFSVWASGRSSKLPDPESPSVSSRFTRAQIQSGARLPVPRSGRSTRIAVGLEMVQPTVDGVTDNSEKRLRLNALSVALVESQRKQ